VTRHTDVSGGAEKIEAVRGALLAFFDAHARDLPWRRARDPYATWVSEIMLQQTRVDTVVPYYARFLDTFPTVHALAEAPIEDVLAQWSGLGYYRRARMLHAGAKVVAESHGGRIPETVDALVSLPGIGRYTAGAIASIAFGRAEPVVDGNVVRVVARIFGIAREVSPSDAEIWSVAGALAQGARPGDLNQALMELGATVCAPEGPRCDACPVRERCDARARGAIDAIPLLAKKKRPPVVAMSALVVTKRDAVLLLRRRDDGLFGGMWEPPMLARPARGTSAAVASSFGELLGRDVTVRRGPAARVRHVLSHKDLRIAVVRGDVAKGSLRPGAPYEAARFVSPAEMNRLGVSRLAEKIVAAVPTR
jgi:A/G-specific adenine glycosylase